MGFLDNILSSTVALHSRKRKRESELFEPQELALLPDQPRPNPANVNPCNSNVCAHCNHRLEPGLDGNALVCERCGIEARTVACAEEETRTFADDDAETMSTKKRAEYDKRDSQHEMCTFDERVIADDSVRRVATNRLNQVLVWLRWLRAPGVPGELALTDDEADTFTVVARMACLQWAKESHGRTEDGEGTDAHFGSPVFWAIGLALGVVARRPGGFNVPTDAMIQRFTMDALHARLKNYKSFAVVTDEKIGNRTRANGQGAAGAKVADEKTRRHARFDSLGDDAARKRKLQFLNGLIKRSGVWGAQGEDPYVIGLAKPVLQCLPPGRLPTFRYTRVGAALVDSTRLITVTPKATGVDADTHVAEACTPMQEAESNSGCAGAQPPTEQALEAQAARAAREAREALETRELNASEVASEVDSDDLASMLTTVDGEPTMEQELESALADDEVLDGMESPPADFDPFGEAVTAEAEGETTATESEAEAEAEAEAAPAPPPAPTLAPAPEPAMPDELELDGEAEGESEGEGEGETAATGSEAAESEMGELPDDLDVDDDIWEAEQVAAEPAPAPALPEPSTSLKVKRPYIKPNDVKHADRHAVAASSNYFNRGEAFWRQWVRERREWREKCRARKAAKEAKERLKIDKKARREAERAARLQQEADTKAANQEARAFNQLLTLGARREMVEEKGGFAVVPTEGPSTTIRIQGFLPPIKIGGKKADEVKRKLDTLVQPEVDVKTVRLKLSGEGTLVLPAAPSKPAVASQGRAAGGTSAAGANPYGRAFKARERGGTRAASAAAGVPPFAPPPALLPNAAAGPVSAAAAAGELSYRSVRLELKGERSRV